MDVLFAGAGLGLIIAVLLGPVKIGGFEPPVPKSTIGRVGGGTLGVGCLAVAFAIGGWIPIPPPPPPPTPSPTTTPTGGGDATPSPGGATVGPSVTQAPLGCVLTISNPFASIHEEPDDFSPGDKVPTGDYSVSETREVEFAGTMQRWFRITVGSKSGWVRDDTILIASKSADCP